VYLQSGSKADQLSSRLTASERVPAHFRLCSKQLVFWRTAVRYLKSWFSYWE